MKPRPRTHGFSTAPPSPETPDDRLAALLDHHAPRRAAARHAIRAAQRRTTPRQEPAR